MVGQIHTYQHITGNTHAANSLLDRVLVFDNGFHRNLNLENFVLGLKVLDAGLDTGLHLVLVTRVGVHHVPVTNLAAQLRFELFERAYSALIGCVLGSDGRIGGFCLNRLGINRSLD